MSERKRTDPTAAAPPVEAGTHAPEKKARQTSTRLADLGKALQMLRRQRKIATVTVAEALGVDVAVVSRWESGQVSPRLENLGALAEFYGLHLGDLDDLIAVYADRPRALRTVRPPRNAAEAETLALALAPPPPVDSKETDGNAGYRQILRAVLLQLVPRNGNGLG